MLLTSDLEFTANRAVQILLGFIIPRWAWSVSITVRNIAAE